MYCKLFKYFRVFMYLFKVDKFLFDWMIIIMYRIFIIDYIYRIYFYKSEKKVKNKLKMNIMMNV